MGIEVRSLRSAELGNAAHVLIERDSGVAVVLDPVRDVGQYLDVATSESVELTWALETHVHNDFVSGARELVASAGARLGASGAAGLRYPYERLGDGDEIEVGSWRLRVLGTPGHTPEHVAYVLVDPAGEPQALFSGGALMVGTAARTDLFGPALSWRFAHDLERTLKEKILELPDHVVVYPTHGGGSFCAAGAGTETTTTIGAERAANPLASASSSRQFVIRALTAGTYPSYYARMRSLNQAGAPLLGPRPPVPPPLDLGEVDTWLAQGALMIDVRPAAAFRAGHIPTSVAAWRAAGRELVSYETISAASLAKRLDADELLPVVDVREAAEWHAAHVPGSVNIPAHDIPVANADLPRGMALAVHCGHDYRATLGASLFERAGHSQLIVVDDGWEGWAALDHDNP